MSKESREQKWEKNFSAFLEYKERFDTHYISSKPQFKQLRSWAQIQRSKFRKNTLKPDHYEKLISAGFIFDPDKTKWDNWYKQLVEYKNKFGHPNVTYRQEGYYKLSIWLHNQRRAKDKLPEYRKIKF